jgi:hypothetical protein
MTIRTKNPNLLDNPPIPVQAKLAAAWTSFMFLYIYVDYFHLYKPCAIDDILVGVVLEFDISPALIIVFLALVAIPALMVMLAMTLPARVNRATNLVVASLYIPVTVFNAVWGPGTGPPSTASPSDSRCCSWPSSCASPGYGPARPHRRYQTSSNPTGRRSRWDGRHKASIRTAGLTKDFGDLRAPSTRSTSTCPRVGLPGSSVRRCGSTKAPSGCCS